MGELSGPRRGSPRFQTGEDVTLPLGSSNPRPIPRAMVLAAPGSPLFDYQISVCRACPLKTTAPATFLGKASSLIGGAVMGEIGVCSVCGCAIVMRAATSCPVGRF